MNWFTRSPVNTKDEARIKVLIEEDGSCKHVRKNVKLAFMVRREVDSFGTVGQYVCCDACDQKANEAEDNETHTCCDCSQVKPLKEGQMWRWYDFYAPQGDEPLFVCNDCRKLPKHIERVRKDKTDYEAEMGFDDCDDPED